jgi:hypothetical protein
MMLGTGRGWFFASTVPTDKIVIHKEMDMNNTVSLREDTPAWIFQVWVSFVLSTGMMLYGIWNLDVGFWIQSYLAMGMLFVVSSCFALAKTLRDQQENRQFINRIHDAKTEKILSDFEVKRG